MKESLFKDLREVFKDNSIKNMESTKNGPMPHKGNEFFISSYLFGNDNEVSLLLNKGNFWHHSKNSICSYISLNDSVYDEKYHCIEYGPQSRSSSNKIEFLKIDNKVRVLASGWGTSSILLWEGNEEDLLNYLREYQKRD